MTSPNEPANGQGAAESASPSESKETNARTTTRRQPKSSIVKAESLVKADANDQEGVVFVLNDHTRITPTDYLPNHRPIALSDFHVVGSLDMAGDRPIMADSIEIFATDLLPGHRPVAVSTLPISDLNFLPNNRPIAPNDVVDPSPSVLMGYLD